MLFVEGLPASFSDQQLVNLFSPYKTILSAKVIKDHTGNLFDSATSTRQHPRRRTTPFMLSIDQNSWLPHCVWSKAKGRAGYMCLSRYQQGKALRDDVNYHRKAASALLFPIVVGDVVVDVAVQQPLARHAGRPNHIVPLTGRHVNRVLFDLERLG
jgi:hypothetical protein